MKFAHSNIWLFRFTKSANKKSSPEMFIVLVCICWSSLPVNEYGKSDNLEVRHLSPTKKDVHSKIATTENTMNIFGTISANWWNRIEYGTHKKLISEFRICSLSILQKALYTILKFVKPKSSKIKIGREFFDNISYCILHFRE